MSVWTGAHQLVQDALSAVTGAWTGMKRGGSTRPDSMEQLALTVKRAAGGMAGMPECKDFVAQLTDMAERYASGDRPTQQGFSGDRDRLTLIREELFRRMSEGQG